MLRTWLDTTRCVCSHGRVLLRRGSCSVRALRHVVYWFSLAVRAPGAGRPEEMDASGNYPSPVWVCQAWSICAGRAVSGQGCYGLAAKPAALLALESPCPVQVSKKQIIWWLCAPQETF